MKFSITSIPIYAKKVTNAISDLMCKDRKKKANGAAEPIKRDPDEKPIESKGNG